MSGSASRENHMYEEHDLIETPQESAVIWRYVDFTKFVALLHSRALFFCRVDRFDDPWEGVLPPKLSESIDRVMFVGTSDSRVPFSTHFRRVQIPSHLINCWHCSEYESAAMWSLYARTNQSVAVRSSIGRLRRCFSKTTRPVVIGKVDYCDYANEGFPSLSMKPGRSGVLECLKPFFSKRSSFDHEREVRALTYEKNDDGHIATGVNVEVDVEALVETVYVAPNSPEWFLDTMRSVMDKYGLQQIEAIHSPLDALPIM